MATNTIKQLAHVQLGIAAANVGATGTAAGTMIKQINLINLAGTSQTVELFIGTTGTSAVADQVYKATLAAGDSAVFEGLLVVPSGSFLVGRSTSATSVTISTYGMEMV